MKAYINKKIRQIGALAVPPCPQPELRTSPSLKVSQVQLFNFWRSQYKSNLPLPEINEVGFRVFSQFEEDGILLFIFSILGMNKRVCVDIGAGDGLLSNVANLILNWGWTGLLIDGNDKNVEKGKKYYQQHPDSMIYPPKFLRAFVTAENINALIENEGINGGIDLLSLDIDGNDFWVWKALSIIDPKVVVIETNNMYGSRSIVFPYDKDHTWPGKHPKHHSASAVAMTKLAKEKGYRLVASNLYGFNLFFVRNGLGEEALPEIDVHSVLTHPYTGSLQSEIEELKDFDFVQY